MLISAEEASKILRVCLVTVHRLARKGELPGKKIGKYWYIDKEKLEDVES